MALAVRRRLRGLDGHRRDLPLRRGAARPPVARAGSRAGWSVATSRTATTTGCARTASSAIPTSASPTTSGHSPRRRSRSRWSCSTGPSPSWPSRASCGRSARAVRRRRRRTRSLGSGLTVVFGRPLIWLNYQQADREASLRAELVHLRENAESVAIARREGRLGARLLGRVDDARREHRSGSSR